MKCSAVGLLFTNSRKIYVEKVLSIQARSDFMSSRSAHAPDIGVGCALELCGVFQVNVSAREFT
jgi:hypothetical protein